MAWYYHYCSHLVILRSCVQLNFYVADHVAVVAKLGAMENWGLITYSEELLLTNPETSSAVGYFYVARLIAHEISHQVYDPSMILPNYSCIASSFKS